MLVSVSGDSAEGCNRKATSTSQRGLRSLRSNPRVLHRKEKNIYRINRLPLRSSGFTCVDVVGTGLQTGLRGTVFSKVRNLGYRTRLAVKTETNDLFRQLKLRAPCPLARVMFIAIRIRCSGAWSPQDPDTTKRQPSMFSRFVRIPAESPNF